MSVFIILLRGINVGGKNILPMKELKLALEASGFEGVRTYIQSGNVVLSSARNPEKKIASLIQSKFGFSPDIMVLSEKEFNSAMAKNPYNEFEGKSVHLYFCKKSPKINSSKLEELVQPTENYTCVDNVFYLHAPNGIGRSKLVSNLEACLSTPATGRNLNTVNKITEMVKNV